MTAKTLGRPRNKPAEERRSDLMEAAARLFLEKGVEHTTIDEITQGAAVSKGAFYLHFSSKGDVVEALRARFVQDLANRIDSAVAQAEGGWDDRLAAWAKACATGYLEASRLHGLIFSAAPAPAREGLTRNILVSGLATLLADGNRKQAWTLENADFTAVFLFSALHGVVNEEPAVSRDRLLGDIEAHFRQVVGLPAKA